MKFPSGMGGLGEGAARARVKRRERRVRVFWREGMVAGVVASRRGVG